MTRGRKPDTDAQQAAKGNPGKRLNEKELQAARTKSAPQPVSIGKVRPPKWIKKSRKATEVWNDLAPRLERLNLLTDLDAFPLHRYCRTVVEWIAADLSVQKEGTWFDATDTNGNKTKKRHPAFQAWQDLGKILNDMEAPFGMRPDARYKILRDQAAASGLGAGIGGLFGNNQPPKSDSPAQPEPSNEQEDMVSVLQGFNSVPPGQLN